MILNGRLEDWSVRDLLQIIRITAKTAALEVKTEVASGVLFFDDGALVDATLEPSTTSLDTTDRIIEAVYVLSMQSDGTFAVGEATPASPTDPVPVDDVLERAGAFTEAETALRSAGLLDAAALRVGLRSREETVSPGVWSALASLVGEFTFEELCERVGRSRAVTALREMKSVGLLEAAFEVGAEPSADATVDGPASKPRLDALVAAAVHHAVEPVVDGESDTEVAVERKPSVGVAAPPDTRLVDISDIGGRFRASGA